MRRGTLDAISPCHCTVVHVQMWGLNPTGLLCIKVTSQKRAGTPDARSEEAHLSNQTTPEVMSTPEAFSSQSSWAPTPVAQGNPATPLGHKGSEPQEHTATTTATGKWT